MSKRECTYDASGETTRHQGEADEEEQPRAPYGSRVSKALLSAHTVLVDQIDDKHAQQGAYPRHPVDERNMHGRRDLRFVERRMRVRGEDRSIEERPIGQRELFPSHAADTNSRVQEAQRGATEAGQVC